MILTLLAQTTPAETGFIVDLLRLAERWGPTGGIVVFIAGGILFWKYAGKDITNAAVTIIKEHTIQSENQKASQEAQVEITKNLSLITKNLRAMGARIPPNPDDTPTTMG